MTRRPRQIAVVRNYTELIAALRKRIDELGLKIGVPKSPETDPFDKVAGLPAGYACKLLAPVPLKSLGQYSMGPILTCLGLSLVVIEDLSDFAAIEGRLPRRIRKKLGDANDVMLTVRKPKRRRYPRRDSEWGRVMSARRMLVGTPEQRSKKARRAASARWARHRRAKKLKARSHIVTP